VYMSIILWNSWYRFKANMRYHNSCFTIVVILYSTI